MAYDHECAELADYVLMDSKDELAKRELAQHIQDAIDGWFTARLETNPYSHTPEA